MPMSGQFFGRPLFFLKQKIRLRKQMKAKKISKRTTEAICVVLCMLSSQSIGIYKLDQLHFDLYG